MSYICSLPCYIPEVKSFLNLIVIPVSVVNYRLFLAILLILFRIPFSIAWLRLPT